MVPPNSEVIVTFDLIVWGKGEFIGSGVLLFEDDGLRTVPISVRGKAVDEKPLVAGVE